MIQAVSSYGQSVLWIIRRTILTVGEENDQHLASKAVSVLKQRTINISLVPSLRLVGKLPEAAVLDAVPVVVYERVSDASRSREAAWGSLVESSPSSEFGGRHGVGVM